MRFSKMTVDERRSAPRRSALELARDVESSSVMLDDTWLPPDVLWNEADMDPTWIGPRGDASDSPWAVTRGSAYEIYDFCEPFID